MALHPRRLIAQHVPVAWRQRLGRRLRSERIEVSAARITPAGLRLQLRPWGGRALVHRLGGRVPREIVVPVAELSRLCPVGTDRVVLPGDALGPAGVRWPATTPRVHGRVRADGEVVTVQAGPDPRGRLRAEVSRRRLGVRGARLVDPRRLELTLELPGLGTTAPGDPRLVLVGARQELPVRLTATDRGEVDLRPRLPYGSRPTTPRPGSYRLELRAPARLPLVAVSDVLPEAELQHVDDELTLRTGSADNGIFTFDVHPTRSAEDTADDGPSRLRQVYRAAVRGPRRELVFLNCFDGRSTSDNVGPVAAELARRRPDLEQYWAVADHSLELPAGAHGVLLRTRQWWEVQASARVVVTNSWLSTGYQPTPGQTILQTWHGTPFKTLGLDRLVEGPRAERVAGLHRHARLWDLLLAQNAYSADVLRRAYGFAGEPLVVGYPRNDRLVQGLSHDDLAQIRHRLGVGPQTRIVLYAPTFRDDVRNLFRGLDFDRVVAGLTGDRDGGEETVLLVRGHTNTIRRDHAVDGPGVIDVTLYPELTDLFAVADALVTDYSSAMFDFALTGRPIIFFVPDLDDYAGRVRGSYFNLADEAPGPLVSSTDDVVAALLTAWDDDANGGSPHTAAYQRWRMRYLSAEQGTATRRTVDALLELVERTESRLSG